MSPNEDSPKDRRNDAIAGAAILAIAIVFGTAALREPPAHYDPLGPGTVPLAVSIVLGIFGAILLIRTLLGLKVGQAAQSVIAGLSLDDPEVDYKLRPGLAVFTYAATAAYVGAIALGIPFVWSTFAFLAIVGSAMARFRRPLIWWVLGSAAAGTYVIHLLFVKILMVSLP